MIIAAVFSVFAGVFLGGLGALAAGLGGVSGLTFSYWAGLVLTLVGGICQLIAGIKGVKHSKSSENSKNLIVWGVIVAAFSMAMNMVNGASFSISGLLTGVAVSALYIYGAILNSKSGSTVA